MKWFLISISFLLMDTSCQRHSNPPTEVEVKNVLTDWNHIKFSLPSYPDAPFIPGWPSEIKHMNVMEIRKKKGSGKLFIAKIVVEGMENRVAYPRKEFIDSIELELKKREKIWVIENMKHRFKYLKQYPAEIHF